MYKAMSKEEGIVGKNASTRKAEPNKEVHFFLQSPMMRTLTDVKNCKKLID